MSDFKSSIGWGGYVLPSYQGMKAQDWHHGFSVALAFGLEKKIRPKLGMAGRIVFDHAQVRKNYYPDTLNIPSSAKSDSYLLEGELIGSFRWLNFSGALQAGLLNFDTHKHGLQFANNFGPEKFDQLAFQINGFLQLAFFPSSSDDFRLFIRAKVGIPVYLEHQESPVGGFSAGVGLGVYLGRH